jgi:hypothetical protein
VSDIGKGRCHPCQAAAKGGYFNQIPTDDEGSGETIACNLCGLPHMSGGGGRLDLAKYITHFKD